MCVCGSGFSDLWTQTKENQSGTLSVDSNHIFINGVVCVCVCVSLGGTVVNLWTDQEERESLSLLE